MRTNKLHEEISISLNKKTFFKIYVVAERKEISQNQVIDFAEKIAERVEEIFLSCNLVDGKELIH